MIHLFTRMPARLFLVSLLAVDWATDPYNGRSPLSAPLSSQPAVDESIGLRPTSYKPEPMDSLLCLLPPVNAFFSLPGSMPSGQEWNLFAFAGTERIYLLMAILR